MKSELRDVAILRGLAAILDMQVDPKKGHIPASATSQWLTQLADTESESMAGELQAAKAMEKDARRARPRLRKTGFARDYDLGLHRVRR